MIFVADSGGACMSFDTELFLVHTMDGKCMIFVADRREGRWVHDGGEVHDICY